jgi:hypothetical protein
MKPFTHLKPHVRWLIVSLFASLSVALPALADNTSLAQVIGPGLLTLTAPDHALLSTITLNHAQNQTSSGSLGPTTIDDSRGSYVGWTVSATASNLVSYGTFTSDSGDPSPFSASGNYTPRSDVDYTLKLGNGSRGLGLGKMDYTLYAGASIIVSGSIAASQPIGATGLNLIASDTNFTPLGTYHLHVHVIPISGLTITPVGVATISGAADGVTAGTAHTLTGTNDPVTLVSSPAGYGGGLYQAGANLSLAIPANAQPGVYSGQIIETIN